MKRTYLIYPMIALLLWGCSAPADRPIPAPAPAAPAMAPPNYSVPGPVAEAEAICAHRTQQEKLEAFRKREQLLMAALSERLSGVGPAEGLWLTGAAAPCLAVERVDGNGAMLVVRIRNTGWFIQDVYGIAVWLDNGTWRFASLLKDMAGNGLILERITKTSPSFEAIMRYRMDGTGVVGGFLLVQFTDQMQVRWKGDLHEQFMGRVLSDNYLLATYRDPEVWHTPQYYGANCCLPTTAQTVWERRGDGFIERCERRHPSIYETASVFLGAWNRGMFERAALWAVDESAVPAMLGAAEKPPWITLASKPPEVDAIDKTEREYWEALPPEFRGPAPTITEFEWFADPKPLLFRRVNGEWKVAGWK